MAPSQKAARPGFKRQNARSPHWQVLMLPHWNAGLLPAPRPAQSAGWGGGAVAAPALGPGQRTPIHPPPLA